MKRTITLLSGLAIALAACGGDDAVSVDDAWARSTAAGQTAGAVYFQLEVADDDVLVGASVPVDVAAAAEVHEVVPAEMGDMDEMSEADDGQMTTDEMDDTMMETMDDSTDESMDMGAMTMREMTDGLPLQGGETVSFEPGGYHIMLLDLVGPLEVGDEVEVTLDFEVADDTTVTAEVSETAP